MCTGKTRNVAHISFGKDSTCMILMLIEKKYPLDEAVFFNTGMEFEAIYHVQDMVVPYLQQMGIRYTELHPEKPFLWNMLERPVCKRGTDIVHQYGYSWCGVCRWGTSIKLNSLGKYTRDAVNYVGLAADEEHRFMRGNLHGRCLPLAEWGMTEKDALNYCYSLGIRWEENGIPLYDILDRVSCWFCGNKNLKELRNIRKYLPAYWERLKELQRKTSRPYRMKDQMTVFDLDKRFAKEEEGIYHQKQYA